jgi:hypothetical protein
VLVLAVWDVFVAAVVPKFCVDVCPHPVVAKVNKAAQIAMAKMGKWEERWLRELVFIVPYSPALV